MKKNILVLIFNDKIYYYYKRKNILDVIDAPNIIDGVSIIDYKAFKKTLEKQVLKDTSIFEFIKPNLTIIVPFNYKANSFIIKILSSQIIGKIKVIQDKNFFEKYLLKNNSILIFNNKSVDYIIRRNKQIISYNLSNKIDYLKALEVSILNKDKLYIFNNQNTQDNELLKLQISIPCYYFSNINNYVKKKLKLYNI